MHEIFSVFMIQTKCLPHHLTASETPLPRHLDNFCIFPNSTLEYTCLPPAEIGQVRKSAGVSAGRIFFFPILHTLKSCCMHAAKCNTMNSFEDTQFENVGPYSSLYDSLWRDNSLYMCLNGTSYNRVNLKHIELNPTHRKHHSLLYYFELI